MHLVDKILIEGDEKSYWWNIVICKKAHAIFIRFSSPTALQKGMKIKRDLEKIKEHLVALQTEVYTIFNKRINN